MFARNANAPRSLLRFLFLFLFLFSRGAGSAARAGGERGLTGGCVCSCAGSSCAGCVVLGLPSNPILANSLILEP